MSAQPPRASNPLEVVAEETAPESTPRSSPSSADAATRYTIRTAVEIATPLPPISWVCEGLRLPRGALVIVGGYGYSRKTMFAQDIALSVATGADAIGVYSVVAGPVVHFDYEQGQRITDERYQRLAFAKRVDLASSMLHTITFPKFRLTDGDARDVLRRIFDLVKPVLVVTDSLKAACPGVDENDSRIREYIDVLGETIKEYEASGVLVHHARKPAKDTPSGSRFSLRGSSAIFDAVDGTFVFSAEKGEPTTVAHEKDRYVGNELGDFALDTEDVPDGSNPRAGLRLVHVETEQLRQREAVASEAESAALRVRYEQRVEETLRGFPGCRWQGSRSSFAKRVGGRTQTVLAALGALISTGRIRETNVRRKEALEWVG